MAYPNKTSQSLHTLKINKVPDKETFLKMYDDNLVNANELYLVEGDIDYPVTSVNGQTGAVTIDVPNADDHKWNDVELNKNSAVTQSNIYIPYLATTTSTSANLISTNNAQIGTNAANKIPKYNNSGYLISTTPTANDNSTKVATTAYVDNAVPTKTSDLTNDSGFTTNTGTITKVSVNGTTVATTGAANITSIPASIINGTLTNTQLANNKITIAGNDVSLGGTLAADTLRISLGLSNAMHFKGTTTTALTDGTTTAAVTINSSSYTPSAGDVVLYDNKEFVWTGSLWEILGDEGSYKIKQSAVSNPTANGNTTAFIDTISQDANGVITVTKKNLDTSGTWSGNATTATTATKLGTATVGSATKPIYLASGTATEGSTYAGGTAVTLNNSSKAASTASFYAPTAAGSSGQVLKSNGNGQAPTWTTLNVESPITYANDTIGFDGYDVTTTTTTLCNETVTTSDEYNPISGDLVYSNLIDADLIKVTFNGVEYICPRMDSEYGVYYYGAAKPDYVDFSEYPFGLQSSSYNVLITKAVGTYTVKIETITDNITVSSNFAKARGYSIVENPSQILVNESTTTTAEPDSDSTIGYGTLSYFSNSNDVIKVTFNNVEYICPRNNSNYSYGAQYDSSLGDYDFSTYPFNLNPFIYDGNNSTNIITQTAGTYVVKIENFPTVAVLTNDFKQAIKSSFPGNVMIQGVDYVTAGQKSDSSLGASATAEGYNTTASGSYSHAEGTNTTASGGYSHAEGQNTTASTFSSHAEGTNTTASGQYSHAEGTNTTASGGGAHAEGANTTAIGSYSHAEGSYTTASGNNSHAEGSNTTANHRSQHVFGEYNVLDTSTAAANGRGNYVEIVGKGTSNSARSNARTLDWNGNEVLAGKLTVGTGPTANMDVATKKYVDDATSNTGTVTSVRVQATSPVVSSVNTAQSTSLDTTISLADGYGDTKNPYASKTKNYVLAAPSSANGVPSFRALVADDIPSLTKSKISDFPTIPTKTSDLTNDSGFITTDEKVKQTAKSDNVNYKLLFTNSASPTSGNAAEAAYDTDITINPSTNTITATNFAGNATSATKATKLGTSSANTSAGSASVPVYFDEGVPVPVSLDDLRTDMGITNPITFWGVTTTTLTNGSTTTSLAGLSGNPQNGYVVIDGNGAQFIWGTVNNVAQWNQLGTGVAYKIIQSAVSSPTANGSTTAFIDTISQNANGVISVTKKNLDTSGTWSGSAAKLTTARSLKTKLDSTTAVTFDGSAAQDAIPVTGTLPIGNGGTGATTAKAARENLGAAPTPFVAGTQTASTNVWTGALPSNVTEYYNGLTIDYFLPYAGTSSAATLNLGGLGAKPVYVGNAATTAVTTHFPANSVLHLTYIVNSALNSGNGCWKVSAYQNSTYYYESCYVTTGASTAAKVGTLSNYALQPGYLQVAIYNANTAASALTLNINGTGAKPIYINGTASSSSNYTLPKGMYFVYYNGTNFYFRTDGMIQGKIQSAVQDGSGNNIASTYQTKHKTATITIAVADWSNNTCTKTATGVTASNTIFVSPAPDSLSTYGEAGVYCSAQAANSLTFICTATPTASVSVNVVIFD